jgi:hypothetical protein
MSTASPARSSIAERIVSGRRLDHAGGSHSGERLGDQIALVALVVDDEEAQAAKVDRSRAGGDELDHDASPPAG